MSSGDQGQVVGALLLPIKEGHDDTGSLEGSLQPLYGEVFSKEPFRQPCHPRERQQSLVEGRGSGETGR